MPKILKKSFELGYTTLSEKENELLNKHFKLENIDKLVEALNNKETEKSSINCFIVLAIGQLFLKN